MESAEPEKKRKLNTEESDDLKVKRIKDGTDGCCSGSTSGTRSSTGAQKINNQVMQIEGNNSEKLKHESVNSTRILSEGEITESSSDSESSAAKPSLTKSLPHNSSSTKLESPSVLSAKSSSCPKSLMKAVSATVKSAAVNPPTSQSAANNLPSKEVNDNSQSPKCPYVSDMVDSDGRVLTSGELEDGELSDEDSDLEMCNEAHRLLEELSEKPSPQPAELKSQDGEKRSEVQTRVALRLKEMIPMSQLNILPADWREITHESGIKLYIHLPTRVLTTTRPWQIPRQTVRAKNCNIPLTAIPCLAYRRARDIYEKNDVKSEEHTVEKSKSEPDLTSDLNKEENQASEVTGFVSECQTTATSKLSNTLEHKEVTEYAKKVFIFNEVSFEYYDDWKLRRDKQRDRKEQEHEEKMLSLVDDPEHLIRVSITHLPEVSQRDEKDRLRRDLILNPTRGYTELVRQYFMWASKTSLDVQTNKDGVQFESVVKADGVKYATYRADTKRAARDGACQIALSVVIPGDAMDKLEKAKKEKKNTGDQCSSVRIFESISVTDPRVCQLSKDVGQVNPHQILRRCMKMNLALDDDAIKVETIVHRTKMHNKVDVKMSVGELTSMVSCKNAKIGQQMTAQEILQKLHPHVRSWAAILKMYGDSAVGNIEYQTRIKEEQLKITSIPAAAKNKKDPDGNTYVLNRLREHMKEIYQHRKMAAPKQKLEPLISIDQLFSTPPASDNSNSSSTRKQPELPTIASSSSSSTPNHTISQHNGTTDSHDKPVKHKSHSKDSQTKKNSFNQEWSKKHQPPNSKLSK